jgi:hypothetical protein
MQCSKMTLRWTHKEQLLLEGKHGYSVHSTKNITLLTVAGIRIAMPCAPQTQEIIDPD